MTSITSPTAIAAILEFMFPCSGQIIELPGSNRVLLHFTDEGSDYRVAWFSEGAALLPQNVQTCALNRLEPAELAVIRDLINNPQRARVLDWV
jgi:hypothetical protein